MSKTANAAPEITPEQIEEYRCREAIRLDNGTYVQLPISWRISNWFCYGMSDDELTARNEAYWQGKGPRLEYCAVRLEHFAHVSMVDGAMIAFTENHAKGVADRQTRMKAGKYLKKYYGHVLSDEQIRDMATEFGAEYAPMDLRFAEDADDIEHVYRNGPNSCMSHHPSDYHGHCHPVRAYAGPDLQIAYIGHGDDIKARCVVWPAKKIHARIYGDSTRIKPLLREAGYKEGSLAGARLTAIPEDGAYVVPYVDCCANACDETQPGYLVLGSGAVYLKETGGLSDCNRATCGHCGTGICEDSAYWCEGLDSDVCEDCYSNLTVYCERPGEQRLISDAVAMANGEHWSQRVFNRDGFTCPVNGDYPTDDGVEMADGELWSQDAFDDGGFTCAGNGKNYSRAVMVVMGDGTLWSQEHFDDYGHVATDGSNARNADAPDDAIRYRCPETLEMDLRQPVATPDNLEVRRARVVNYGPWNGVTGTLTKSGTTPYWTLTCDPNEFEISQLLLARSEFELIDAIVVGDWVECVSTFDVDGQFTRGRMYQVSFVGGGRIVVYADDSGGANGWDASNFIPAFSNHPALVSEAA